MVERQAVSRVDRLGQKRDVRVVRYVVKGTVEEVFLNILRRLYFDLLIIRVRLCDHNKQRS